MGRLGIMIAVVAGLLLARPASALACSGPLVTLTDAVNESVAIALVEVSARRQDDTGLTLDLAVLERYRGSIDDQLTVHDLPWHACGDVVDAQPRERLVVAFGVDAFVGQPPMNPYWRVLADDVLDPEAIDDEGVGWQTLDDVRAAFGMFERDGATPQPAQPTTSAHGDDAGWRQLVGPIGLTGLIGIGLFGLVVIVARATERSRRRDA